ncbi:hypothetical protein DFH06DRAFT_1192023 [Mycena polygramma]|nr:hypothetical protein DFH06DRAFT_1192023 [Mycena polygramma]
MRRSFLLLAFGLYLASCISTTTPTKATHAPSSVWVQGARCVCVLSILHSLHLETDTQPKVCQRRQFLLSVPQTVRA